jgi:predicted GIY-YIG superfamily endonuclease
MYYVYLLQSLTFPDQIYIGFTQNINKRLSNHNSGTTSHTAKYIPWKLVVSLEFEDKVKALEFENYLKSGSGRAFIKKRFL